MSDTKKITKVPGSIWISKKTNQLRFKHKDTNSEWLIPTSVYKAGANILRGQVVALGDVKDKGTGPFIVPYNEDSQLFHSWPLGIALEPGNSENMIHVLSKGKLEYNSEKYPEESIDSHFIQSLDLSEEDIGLPIFVLPNGEFSKTEDPGALCVGRILYAPGNEESSNKIIIEFDFSYGESLFTKKKRKELKVDLENKLDDKADKVHKHKLENIDDLEEELDGKADKVHKHKLENIDDLEEELDDKADKEHSHKLEDIDDLENKLDDKADEEHSHKLKDISDFDTELPSKIEKFAGNCIAIFDPDNGDHFSFSVKAKGGFFTVPSPEPTKKNYTFMGWEVIEPEPEPEPEELKKEPFEANHSVLLRAQYCSSDATLSDLVSSTGDLSPAFSPTTTSYTITVPYETTSLTITGVTADSNASMEPESGEVTVSDLEVGEEQTVTITVTAEDGTTTQEYKVKVVRQSNNANLKSLTASTGSLSPAFNASTMSYTITVPNSVTSLKVTGTKSDTKATMNPSNGVLSFTGLSVGTSSEKTIKVTSEDGSVTKEYKVKVYRQSNNATLSKLTTTEGSLNPEFDAATTSYTITVPNSVTSLTVTGTKSDTKATMNPSNGVLSFTGLSVGTSSEKTITVIAEDGETTQEYKVSVYRQSNNTN